MWVEVYNLYLVASGSPLPPEEVVTVLAVNDGRQRVADVVVESGVLQLQVGPLVAGVETAIGTQGVCLLIPFLLRILGLKQNFMPKSLLIRN